MTVHDLRCWLWWGCQARPYKTEGRFPPATSPMAAQALFIPRREAPCRGCAAALPVPHGELPTMAKLPRRDPALALNSRPWSSPLLLRVLYFLHPLWPPVYAAANGLPAGGEISDQITEVVMEPRSTHGQGSALQVSVRPRWRFPMVTAMISA